MNTRCLYDAEVFRGFAKNQCFCAETALAGLKTDHRCYHTQLTTVYTVRFAGFIEVEVDFDTLGLQRLRRYRPGIDGIAGFGVSFGRELRPIDFGR